MRKKDPIGCTKSVIYAKNSNLYMHWVIQFNQKAWLKQNIDLNTKLRAEVKSGFEKDFF